MKSAFRIFLCFYHKLLSNCLEYPDSQNIPRGGCTNVADS